MELQRREATGCPQADTTGGAANLPAYKVGFPFQDKDGHWPACSSAFAVISNKHTRQRN
jgi:hypothetical protein